MKKGLLILCVAALTAAVSFGRDESLANEGKSGLYAKSIEQVLRLREDEVDLATAALIISEHWSDIVHGRRYLLKLDDMALEIRSRLEKKKLSANYHAIRMINEYLFDELDYKAISEASDPNDLFLHSVLDNKRGYCLSLSILYLSIGERLGLPLYGVVVPGHFFVKYDDGRVQFNIETTSKGGNAPDEHYITKFNVPEEDDSIYMKKLSKVQTLGCFLNNLGNSYCDIGDPESALLALETAVEINPSLSESRANLGNLYLNKGRIEDALYEYQTALQINPNDAKTHSNLGNAYTKRGWLNKAIAQYNYAIKLDPNLTQAYRNLASAYSQQEQFVRAEVNLKEALFLEPKDASIYSQLGEVYDQMGNYKEAIFQYKKALKIKRNLAEAHYGIAVCYNKLGMVNDEIRAYKKALAVKPNMVAALVGLGNAYFGKKKYGAAIEQYKEAVRVAGNDGTIYYNLGAAYSNKEDYKQAVAAHLKAVELEPEMGDAHNGLAFAFYKLKKYDLAAKHIKIAEQSGVEIDKQLLRAIKRKLR
ncbi:MAG: tetratricopeptide repeat protein [Planctomycetota bacterium]|jgi:tetratricopeptide (TPR) repeat protein